MQSNFTKITFIVSLLIASTQAVTIKAEDRHTLHQNILAQQEPQVPPTEPVSPTELIPADFTPFSPDIVASDTPVTEGEGGRHDDYDCDCHDDCDACKKNIDFPFVCKCPHLQDCAVNGSAGTGNLPGGSTDVTVTVGTTGNVTIPNIIASHATATNTCGLEVSNNKSCGEKKKYKCFDIDGQINVCERIRTYGCEGERECSDGRYTKTSSSFTKTGN